MKIALAQINTTIGDFPGNARKIVAALEKAKKAGCRLAVFPELALTGYPPSDLLLSPAFVAAQDQILPTIAAACDGIAAAVGAIRRNTSGKGKPLFNSALVFDQKKLISEHHKSLLPTYDVFDEARYFEPARSVSTTRIDDRTFGVSICEDLWAQPGFEEAALYHQDPIAAAVNAGAQAILNLSASPFHLGKINLREKLTRAVSQRHHLPVFYVNLVGGNDSLIFDGGSLAVNAEGRICAEAQQFDEEVLIVDWDKDLKGTAPAAPTSLLDQAWSALVLGLRDYVAKCGFQKVLVGLSGGIDSALVACLAVEALGAPNVWGITMPSRYSASESARDAQALAKNLGIRFETLAIEPMFRAFLESLAEVFKNTPTGIAEENLQARIRGILLMALSNKFNHLVLTTGNKSEMAVGYCTLYGDMNGGLAVLSDVPKTLVYQLAQHVNARSPVIPSNTFTRPPSAELRPDQKDTDSLPAYEILDPILAAYVEESLTLDEIVAKTNADRALVSKIINMVDRAEYKRRQAPPGLRITTKAFGVGRRLPIAQRFTQGRGK